MTSPARRPPADVDAVVIGSGPNGLAAAAHLARRGWSVTVLEAADRPGGAIRSDELTVPGYVHDTGSAFYGVLHTTPVFRELALHERVEWAHFDAPIAAATGPGPERTAVMWSDPAATAAALDRLAPGDGAAWLDIMRWWRGPGRPLYQVLTGPIAPTPQLGRFAARAGIGGALEAARFLLEPLDAVARRLFRSEEAGVLLASGASHSDVAVDMPGSAPEALILALVGQDVGMPVPVGGAGRLAEAMAAAVTDAGGRIHCGAAVHRVVVEGGRVRAVEAADGTALSVGRAVIADTGPKALFLDLVGRHHLPPGFVAQVRRFRYGTGMFRVDLALDGPAPWAAEDLRRAGVVHLMGGLRDMARAAFEARHGSIPAMPALIVGQQSITDPLRAPAGGHTLWIETHVPSVPEDDAAGVLPTGDWAAAAPGFVERVIDRIDDHAPGLRGRIVGVAHRSPVDHERFNPNLVGGDVAGGSRMLDQQLVFRPVPGWFRHRMPVRGLYLCSASSHPGGGVHGLAGRHAARRVLADARWSRI